jgi:hypothetical protein
MVMFGDTSTTHAAPTRHEVDVWPRLFSLAQHNISAISFRLQHLDAYRRWKNNALADF